MNGFKHNSEENYIEIIQRLVKCVVILLVIIVVLLVFLVRSMPSDQKSTRVKHANIFVIKDKKRAEHNGNDLLLSPAFTNINFLFS